jgi:hypothetical protein
VRARSSDLDIDMDDLPKMSPSGLRTLWQRVMGREAPPQMHINRLFLRELAWRIQAKRLKCDGGGAAVGAGTTATGGLDSAIERLLNAAICAHATTTPSPSRIEKKRVPFGEPAKPPQAAHRPSKPRIATLPTTARLVRVYRGITHEVTVLDGGKSFQYRGNAYRSLTAIAQLITRGTTSGPKFFGLTTTAHPRTRPCPRPRDGAPHR